MELFHILVDFIIRRMEVIVLNEMDDILNGEHARESSGIAVPERC